MTETGECRICGAHGAVRHLDLYVFGSEGVPICAACERTLVEIVRGMASAAGRSRLVAAKEWRRKVAVSV